MRFLGSAPVSAVEKGTFCLLFVVLPTPTQTQTPLLMYPVSLTDETSQAGCFCLDQKPLAAPEGRVCYPILQFDQAGKTPVTVFKGEDKNPVLWAAVLLLVNTKC